MLSRPWISFALGALYIASGRAESTGPDSEPTVSLNGDDNFSFQLLAALGLAPFSGSDIAPLLAVAKTIEPSNFTSFSENLYALANATKAAALDPANAYDAVNVRDTWFEASNYFRLADFYLHGNWSDPLIYSLWDEQLAAFDKAIAALPIPGQRVQLPTENFVVEAIWYAASFDQTTRRPTLILGNGYDGSQEDLYSTVVVPALVRGWNCITYEGPGQPTVRRRQNIGFIPDWERAVTPVVDYLLQSHASVVDPSNIVLFGFSFGGYLAARAAAFEPRVAAVVLDGGIYNTFEAFFSQLSEKPQELFKTGNKTAFDSLVKAAVADPSSPTQLRWGVDQGTWSFNTHSPYEFLQKTKEFTLKDVINKIKMPVLTLDAEYEDFFVNQSAKVKAALGSQATYHQFKGAAGYHCQLGAFQELNRYMFGWLHETLGC